MQIQSINPMTGKTIQEFKLDSKEKIQRIIKNAYSNQSRLRNLDQKQIQTLFTNLKSIIETRKEEIIQTIQEEIGKVRADAEYEVYDILAGIDVYLNKLTELEQKKQITYTKDFIPDTDLGFSYEHIGVIGVIMPWNYPFWLSMGAIIPAIMSGNPVVFKPSEYATKTGLLIESLFKEAQFPSYALQTIIGGPLAGHILVKDERIGRIIFVGSTEAGQSIARTRIMHKSNNFTLEMGGNSAAIVLNDADIENAVSAIFWNSAYYAGQVCSRTKRILIQADIYDTFKEKILSLARKYNDPEKLISYVGGIIRKEPMNIFEYRIRKAAEAGNIILSGGKRIDTKDLPVEYKGGNFFPITVIEITNRQVDLIQKETFAPVIPLIKFDTLDEAIRIANETIFGLSANIFTNDEGDIAYLRDHIEAGMIFVNDSEVAVPGGNYWKGLGASYLSTGGDDDRLTAMFNKKVIWRKDPSIKRDYWFSSD